jgi:hypothetical protein
VAVGSAIGLKPCMEVTVARQCAYSLASEVYRGSAARLNHPLIASGSMT